MVMEYRIYRPLHSSKKKGMIIYPPTGGSTFIDRSFARKFCNAGYPTIILTGWPDSQLLRLVDVSAYDATIIRGYYATRHALDILGMPVGAFGMSLGGISALTAGILLPEKVEAVSSVVAALPFADIIATSDETWMEKNRVSREAEFGLHSVDAYREYLRKKITINPLNYFNPVRSQPHLMFLGKKDTTVQSSLQKSTFELFPDREGYVYPGGHLQTVFSVYAHEQATILAFFEKHLDR
jgi:pimeloyl-ACP methyl ester carboxylesterase